MHVRSLPTSVRAEVTDADKAWDYALRGVSPSEVLDEAGPRGSCVWQQKPSDGLNAQLNKRNGIKLENWPTLLP